VRDGALENTWRLRLCPECRGIGSGREGGETGRHIGANTANRLDSSQPLADTGS
jgi:hypothetical protein